MLDADLAVIGSGLGGVAAALTAARLGRRVVLTERDSWLGGQLTVQGVPPDEHPWIETRAASPSYAELRQGIRAHYRRHYPLTAEARADPLLNPGAGFVSRLCHEPRVAALVLEEMLSPLLASGRLLYLREHEPIAVEPVGDTIATVVLRSLRTGEERRVRASLVADATELGDLIVLSRADHVVGAEAREEYGELHAPGAADARDQQAFTWCFALDWSPQTDNVVPRPTLYDRFATVVPDFWPGPQLSFADVEPSTLERRTRPLFAGPAEEAAQSTAWDLWLYRRILARKLMRTDVTGSDVTLVNWPQIDYWDSPAARRGRPDRRPPRWPSRDSCRCPLLYWLQTEAPRPDGGAGYPGLRLRADVTGTADGLAKEPYIREARRIQAAVHRARAARRGRRARPTGRRARCSRQRRDRLLPHRPAPDDRPATTTSTSARCPSRSRWRADPAARREPAAGRKNIGTTHITNGCYRLHPVEWSIGEAVGALTEISHRHRRVAGHGAREPDAAARAPGACSAMT